MKDRVIEYKLTDRNELAINLHAFGWVVFGEDETNHIKKLLNKNGGKDGKNISRST